MCSRVLLHNDAQDKPASTKNQYDKQPPSNLYRSRRPEELGRTRARTVKMNSLHYRLDSVGWLVKCGVVDPTWVYNQLCGLILYHWLKFKPIIYEDRKRTGITNYYENFEYLAGVCDEIGKVKGASLETIRVGNPKWFSEQSSEE